MSIKKSIILFFTGLVLSCTAYGQTDTCKMQISLLTCGPGEELYSIFGHSAIRVKNLSTGRDIIFNYGTFDFYDPAFYTKFVKGKLLYFVSVDSFSDFLREYQYEGRSVTEQILHLDCQAKQQLVDALWLNAKEENKYYHYDFTFDNCSTRLRDILENTNNVQFQNFLNGATPTFRELIHEYLDKGNLPWSKFGIDLLLGSKLDRISSDREAMFLPDYLMRGYDNAIIDSVALVSSTHTVLDQKFKEKKPSFFSPLFFSIALFVIIALISAVKKPWSRKFLNVFDTTYFLTLGLLGVFLLFMWFGTDHQLCANNFNLLWALPTHLPVAFFIVKNPGWVKKYLTMASFLYVVVIITWKWLPQEFNAAFFPLALTAGLRSILRSLNS